MVSAPYLLQLHSDFLDAASVPVPPRPSLFLRGADGGFTRSHRHLLSLPKARGSLGLDHGRDRQKNAPTRARALLRAWVRMNEEAEGSCCDVGKKRALSWLQPRRDAPVAYGPA